ncbi:redoxin domain-containing protein [Mucilaginibacter rigui]|uniref:Redoxin domain-containing protein n=1 Tax=Mucilaginibacter rigui TaxID=534635 RepID=A0ABR7X7R3_9SPHI|nr:TlpA disulfide reductase family protein [Mucilaginibacter rigui]MBD1386609.1 redoxin domain-containing protein [Mucilaginibacter rigui]
MVLKTKFFLLLLVVPLAGYSQSNLLIKGTATLLKDGTEIKLSKKLPKRLADEKPLITKIKDHKFEFSVQTNGSILYTLSNGKGGSQLFLCPGQATILVRDSIVRNVSVTGNSTALDYQKYHALLDTVSLYEKYGRARADYYNYTRNNHNIDSAILNAKIQKRDALLILLNDQLLDLSLGWIKQHPNSPINPFVLYGQITYMPEDDFRKSYYSLAASQKKDIWAKESKYMIDSLFIGGIAPSVSETDAKGNIVTLSSFRGKYVLLDFWAAWCIPCREENPNVVKAAEKYKGQNFTVLSISLDDDKTAWLKAIEKDGLGWTHLSALKGWNDGISKKYYVSSIPANFLIDPNGKIVAKNIRGEELNKTLSMLLSKEK